MGVPGGEFVGTAQAQYGGGSGNEPVDINASDLPGDGSESNPYEISNASELQAMEDDLNANYELVSDIDASNTAQFNDGRGFDPVGEFSGSFDGSDHTITGVTIDRPDTSNVGLLGSNSGIVINVTLMEMSVSGNNGVGGLIGANYGGTVRNTTVSGNVTGNHTVGGLVGDNRGSIQTVTVSGSVSGTERVGGLIGYNDYGGTTQNTTVTGNVIGDETVGGVVGFNSDDGTVQTATVLGSVVGSNTVGGGVGFNSGLIQTVRITGNVDGEGAVGGLVGDNRGRIQTVTVSGSVSGTERVGGLIGYNDGGGKAQNTAVTGDVTGDETVGGVVGFNSDDGTVQTTIVSGSVSGIESVGGLIGYNDGITERSFFDVQATGQTTSAGSAVGLTTDEMQGSAATESMDLAFGETWRTVSGDYPELIALSDADTDSGPDSPLAGAAGEFDADGNGNIEISELGDAGQAFTTGEISIIDLGSITTAFAQPGSGAITGNDVTLSDSNPTTRSDVTVTVTATPKSGSTAFSFRHEFNQSVGAVSDITTQVARSSVFPIIEVTNQNGAIVTLGSGDVTAGDQVTIEYTITTTGIDEKSVSITGTVTNGETQKLPEQSYTMTPPPVTQPVSPTKSIQFDGQSVQDGSTSVSVASATFDGSESFNVVVHKASDDNDDGVIQTGEIGTKIGESVELDPGTRTDIFVNLSQRLTFSDDVSQVTENQTLVAMLHAVDTSDDDGIVHADPITQDGTPVFDQADITITESDSERNPPQDDTSATPTVSRSLSSSEIAPGGTVTLTTEVSGIGAGSSETDTNTPTATITSNYAPEVSSTALQSIMVDGTLVDPIIAEATASGSTVTLADIGPDATITVSEELTVAAESDTIYNITGTASVGDNTIEIAPVSATVRKPPADVDVTRTLSAEEVSPGETVTLSTEFNSVSGSFSLTSSYAPEVSSATVQSMRVNEEPFEPLIEKAAAGGSTVTSTDVGTNATVTVTEELTVADDSGITHNITGLASVGKQTTEVTVKPVSVSVTEPESVVDEYDTDNNGIGITELGQAGVDFASGDLTVVELGKVGAAFAS